MRKGHLFVISGASGVGKSSVLQKVREAQGERLLFSVSATTREPRPGERDGVDYFFVDRAAFAEMIRQNEFVEYDYHHENYYGTLWRELQKKTAMGDLALDIEPNGALHVKEQFPDATLIFLVPPSMEELEMRLRGRNNTDEEQIVKRLDRARWELEQANQYDYVVVNDDLDTCVAQVLKIIAEYAE